MILLELFGSFFWIGLFTFGGGYAMLPLIVQTAAAHNWLPEQTLVDFVAVSESTPGPFAVNIATFIGMRTAGVPGAVCATLGVVLPSFLVILIVASVYNRIRENRFIQGALRGMKAAVVGLIAAALLSVGQTVFFGGMPTADAFHSVGLYVSLGIFLLTVLLAFRKKHPVLLICLAAALGVAAGYVLHLPLIN